MVPTAQQLTDALIASATMTDKNTDTVVSSFVEQLKTVGLEHLIPSINTHLEDRLRRSSEIHGTRVTSAVELDEKTQKIFTQQLSHDDITYTIDPSLLAGCVVNHHGVRYDASLANTLERLRLTLQN